LPRACITTLGLAYMEYLPLHQPMALLGLTTTRHQILVSRLAPSLLKVGKSASTPTKIIGNLVTELLGLRRVWLASRTRCY